MSMSDNCPYCGTEIEISHDDGFGYEEDELHQYQCHECEKYFVFTTCISISHDLIKADCLNDEDHDYQETRTYPRIFTKLRCKTCGDEKPITSERKEELRLLDEQDLKAQND